MLAENVLKLHRYRAQGEPDGTVLPIGNTVDCRTTFDPEYSSEPGSAEVYEKNREWTAVDEG
jgi:DNA replication licensing factor MCM3